MKIHFEIFSTKIAQSKNKYPNFKLREQMINVRHVRRKKLLEFFALLGYLRKLSYLEISRHLMEICIFIFWKIFAQKMQLSFIKYEKRIYENQ